MLMFLLPSATAAPPCGTPLQMTLPRAPMRELPPPPPGREKALRDALGVTENELVSENFVVRWGPGGGVDAEAVADMIDAFEVAWDVEIGEMGHAAPHGTDTWRFNVYLADTGGGTPDSTGYGGLYLTDGDGMPMIFVTAGYLWDPDWRRAITAHEFYHAVQDRAGSYGYTGDSAWYWEATAEWASGEVFPDNPTYAQSLFGYAFLPDYSLDFFEYPDDWSLAQYHQYGAFIFPRYLSEHVADRSMVVESWTTPGVSGSPLAAIEGALAARGLSLPDVFGEFAAHNAAWDYVDGDVYRNALNDAWIKGDDVTDVVSSRGADGWVDAPEATLPQRLAYNIVRLVFPVDGDLHIAFEGDSEGADGSPADWRVTVVVDGPTYLPLTLVDGVGELDLPEVGEYNTVQLVVAAVPERAREGETFAWRYRMDLDADSPPASTSGEEAEEVEACGCADRGAARGPYALLVLPFLLAGARRRRLR